MGRKKGGATSHTVIKADEDVPFFVNITDATVSDQSLIKGLFRVLPRGSWLSFDMGYVNYEAWQEFTDNGIFYVTKEKKRTKAKVLEMKDIPEEDKETIVNDEVVEFCSALNALYSSLLTTLIFLVRMVTSRKQHSRCIYDISLYVTWMVYVLVVSSNPFTGTIRMESTCSKSSFFSALTTKQLIS